MTRVLITGATGFTGRYLAPMLAAAGYEVHGTAQRGDRSTIDGVTALHSLDLTDAKAVEIAMREVAPDKVVHLAAIAFVGHSDIAEMYRTNILGTRNLLEALAASYVSPSAVLIASSANIYGNARAGKLDEGVPPLPANDYAITKVATENLVALYRERLPLIVARPFNYTGIGQSTDFIIPKIVDHARRCAPVIELGNLDVERDFSDVRAVADIYRRLLESPTAVGQTVNVCSGGHHSLNQVIALVEEIAGHQFEISVNPAFVRKNDVHILYGDNKRLAEIVGPIDMPPLSETLRWMIES